MWKIWGKEKREENRLKKLEKEKEKQARKEKRESNRLCKLEKEKELRKKRAQRDVKRAEKAVKTQTRIAKQSVKIYKQAAMNLKNQGKKLIAKLNQVQQVKKALKKHQNRDSPFIKYFEEPKLVSSSPTKPTKITDFFKKQVSN